MRGLNGNTILAIMGLLLVLVGVFAFDQEQSAPVRKCLEPKPDLVFEMEQSEPELFSVSSKPVWLSDDEKDHCHRIGKGGEPVFLLCSPRTLRHLIAPWTTDVPGVIGGDK